MFSRKNEKEFPLLSARALRTYAKASDHMRAMRADGIVIVVDIVTVLVDVAVIVDVCSVKLIAAGGAQPPTTKARTIESPDYVPSDDNRLLSLFIQAPSRFWQSATCLDICSYYFGRIQSCSIDSRATYPSNFKSVIALR